MSPYSSWVAIEGAQAKMFDCRVYVNLRSVSKRSKAVVSEFRLNV